jgi:hypothetical protein
MGRKRIVADPVTLVRYLSKMQGIEMSREEEQRLGYIRAQVQRTADRLFKLRNSPRDSQQELEDENYIL